MNTDFPFTHSTNNEYTINHFSIQQFNDSTNQPPNPLTQSWPLPQDRSSPSRGRGLCRKSARPERLSPKFTKPSMLCFPFPALGGKGTEGMGFLPQTTKKTISPFNDYTNTRLTNTDSPFTHLPIQRITNTRLTISHSTIQQFTQYTNYPLRLKICLK